MTHYTLSCIPDCIPDNLPDYISHVICQTSFQTLRSSKCIPDYSPSCIPDYVPDNHFDYIPNYAPDHQTKTQGGDTGSNVMLQAVEGSKRGQRAQVLFRDKAGSFKGSEVFAGHV